MKRVEKEFVRQACIKPARYEEKATGKSRVMQELLSDGTMVESTVPVVEKTFSPALFEDRIETREFFVVEIGDDVHEFATEKEAKDFMKGSRR
jgi:hypothetical protein